MKNAIGLLTLALVSFLNLPAIAQSNTTNTINFGVITNGGIAVVGQTNFYLLTAASNDVIFATLLRTNGTGIPHFYLYDPSGNLVTGSSQYGGYLALVSGLPVSANGTFKLAVVESSLAGTYDYLLSL